MNMQIQSIRTEQEYKAALEAINLIFDASLGSPEGNYLELLAKLIEEYEDEHYPIEA
ncbi:MAG: hypothetical protein KJZ53_00375 [Anaerolineales bacterium]|nr:hypothetical protein [Anaerolineales bacterium]